MTRLGPTMWCGSAVSGCWAVLFVLVFVTHAAIAHAEQAQAGRRRYDIPAQPLDDALSRYGEATGIDVLLYEPSAAQRRSAAVAGEFSAVEALAKLLEGTGLVARFTSPRSAVIIPRARIDDPWPSSAGRSGDRHALITLDTMRVTAPHVIGAAAADRESEVFARKLADMIRRFVIDRGAMEGGKPTDLRIGARVSADGALHDVRIVKAGHDRATDAKIVALLEGARLGAPPPGSLRQPLLFDLSGR